MLANITPEERAEMAEKARLKKEHSKEYAKQHLKNNCADEPYWRELSSKYSYRLPVWYKQAGAPHVNKFLKKFGLSKEWYEGWTGFKNGNQESHKNPTMSALQQIGILLECYDNDLKRGVSYELPRK